MQRGSNMQFGILICALKIKVQGTYIKHGDVAHSIHVGWVPSHVFLSSRILPHLANHHSFWPLHIFHPSIQCVALLWSHARLRLGNKPVFGLAQNTQSTADTTRTPAAAISTATIGPCSSCWCWCRWTPLWSLVLLLVVLLLLLLLVLLVLLLLLLLLL
jgi:hypothetical protein